MQEAPLHLVAFPGRVVEKALVGSVGVFGAFSDVDGVRDLADPNVGLAVA